MDAVFDCAGGETFRHSFEAVRDGGRVVTISDLVGKVPICISLPLIAIVITVSIAASLWKTRGMVRETLPGSQSATEQSRQERTGVGEG